MCALSAENEIPDRDGVLFNGAVTLADVYDLARKEYLLYPGAPLASEMKLRAGRRVAVIDSGVAQKHPQIAGLVVAERDWTGEGVEDLQGHGTIVALGLIYGREKSPEIVKLEEQLGLTRTAPGLVVAKVAPRDAPIKLRAVIEAIHWAVEQGATMVNLSLGFTGEEKDFRALTKAIEAHPEVMFFAAAGNYGPHVKVYPAACGAKNLIAVGEESRRSGKADILAEHAYRPITAEEYTRDRQEKELAAAMQAAREQRDDEAQKLLRAIVSTPGHAGASEASAQLGFYAARAGKMQEAIGWLEAADKLEPDNALLLAQIGYVYFNLENFAAAENALRKSVALNATDAKAGYFLGVACLRQRKDLAGLAQFEAVERFAPDYPGLADILGQMRAARAAGKLPPPPTNP